MARGMGLVLVDGGVGPDDGDVDRWGIGVVSPHCLAHTIDQSSDGERRHGSGDGDRDMNSLIIALRHDVIDALSKLPANGRDIPGLDGAPGDGRGDLRTGSGSELVARMQRHEGNVMPHGTHRSHLIQGSRRAAFASQHRNVASLCTNSSRSFFSTLSDDKCSMFASPIDVDNDDDDDVVVAVD